MSFPLIYIILLTPSVQNYNYNRPSSFWIDGAKPIPYMHRPYLPWQFSYYYNIPPTESQEYKPEISKPTYEITKYKEVNKKVITTEESGYKVDYRVDLNEIKLQNSTDVPAVTEVKVDEMTTRKTFVPVPVNVGFNYCPQGYHLDENGNCQKGQNKKMKEFGTGEEE